MEKHWEKREVEVYVDRFGYVRAIRYQEREGTCYGISVLGKANQPIEEDYKPSKKQLETNVRLAGY